MYYSVQNIGLEGNTPKFKQKVTTNKRFQSLCRLIQSVSQLPGFVPGVYRMCTLGRVRKRDAAEAKTTSRDIRHDVVDTERGYRCIPWLLSEEGAPSGQESGNSQISQECSRSSYSVHTLYKKARLRFLQTQTENSCGTFEAVQSPGNPGLKITRLQLKLCSVTDFICGLEQVLML